MLDVNILTDTKTVSAGCFSRLDTAEERIYELDYINRILRNQKKRRKTKKWISKDCGVTTFGIVIM